MLLLWYPRLLYAWLASIRNILVFLPTGGHEHVTATGGFGQLLKYRDFPFPSPTSTPQVTMTDSTIPKAINTTKKQISCVVRSFAGSGSTVINCAEHGRFYS